MNELQRSKSYRFDCPLFSPRFHLTRITCQCTADLRSTAVDKQLFNRRTAARASSAVTRHSPPAPPSHTAASPASPSHIPLPHSPPTQQLTHTTMQVQMQLHTQEAAAMLMKTELLFDGLAASSAAGLFPNISCFANGSLLCSRTPSCLPFLHPRPRQTDKAEANLAR